MAIPVKDALLGPYVTNWQTRVATDYAAFGLTAGQAAALTAVYAPWNQAYSALIGARNAGVWSQQQTSDKESAKRAMLPVLRELYAIVQSSREVSDGNKNLLNVKVKSTQQTPRPAPGAVSNFSAEINGDGSLTIRWKSNNPAGTKGTMYQVWRKIDGGPLAYCGGTGTKFYTDTTVPAGATGIVYQVQAVRSTAEGPWTQFNVNFAVGGGRSVVEQTTPKLAA